MGVLSVISAFFAVDQLTPDGNRRMDLPSKIGLKNSLQKSKYSRYVLRGHTALRIHTNKLELSP